MADKAQRQVTNRSRFRRQHCGRGPGIDVISRLRWQTVVDFVALTTAMYLVLHWSRQARALRVTFGILELELAHSLRRTLASSARLRSSTWPRSSALILIVLFQPELRHALTGSRTHYEPAASLESWSQHLKPFPTPCSRWLQRAGAPSL